jgi:hypothetical protein
MKKISNGVWILATDIIFAGRNFEIAGRKGI